MKRQIVIDREGNKQAPVAVKPTASKRDYGLVKALVCMLVAAGVASSFSSNFEEELSRYVPETMTDTSSYNKKPSGYAGCFELSERLKNSTKRWQRPYRELKDPGTLVVVSPSAFLQEFEIEQILKWVEKGNRLVYMDFFTFRITGKSLLDRLKLKAIESTALTDSKIPTEPAAICQYADHLNVSAETRLVAGDGSSLSGDKAKAKDTDGKTKDSQNSEKNATGDGSQDKDQAAAKKDSKKWSSPPEGHGEYDTSIYGQSKKKAPQEPSQQVLAADPNGALLVEVAYGKGRCLVATTPNLCCNRRIADPDSKGNFQLLANTLKDSPGTVFFDEKCHGYSSTPSIFAYLLRGPLGLVVAQILLLFAAAWISLNQRFGPVKRVSTPRRISNLEFIDGMAHTYRKARASDTAWSILFTSFRTRLCKALGATPETATEDLARSWADITGLNPKQCEDFLKRATEAESKHISNEELLELVASCDRLSEHSKQFISIASSKRLSG